MFNLFLDAVASLAPTLGSRWYFQSPTLLVPVDSHRVFLDYRVLYIFRKVWPKVFWKYNGPIQRENLSKYFGPNLFQFEAYQADTFSKLCEFNSKCTRRKLFWTELIRSCCIFRVFTSLFFPSAQEDNLARQASWFQSLTHCCLTKSAIQSKWWGIEAYLKVWQ